MPTDLPARPPAGPPDRLPDRRPEALDTDRRALYDTVTGGPRAQGPKHFPLVDADGRLLGPFAVMLEAPALGTALQALGSAVRFGTDLSPRSREIAILAVAHASGSGFERWAHERVGRAAGLTDDELAALAARTFDGADDVEAAVLRLVGIVLAGGPVPDDEFARLRAVLTVRQLVEVTTLAGYYLTLARLMSLFAVTAPDDAG